MQSEDRTRRWTTRIRIAAGVLLAATLALTGCSSSHSGSSGGSGSSSGGASAPVKLSLSTVGFNGGTTVPPQLPVADGAGYFKDLGLSVTHLPAAGTGADEVTALLSGGAQFFVASSLPAITAAASGAPLVGIMQTNQGGTTTMVIRKSKAAALGIPAANSTAADVLAQFKALKNSKITLGVPSITGDNFNLPNTIAKANGMTVSDSGDFNLVSAGGAPSLLSAYQAGKYDGLVDNAPDILRVTTDTVQIPLYKLAPIATAATNMMVTTQSMISSHPDVVQAVVTAMVRANQLAQKNADQAYQDSVTSGMWYKVSGLTDLDSYHQLFNLWLPGSFQPAVSQAAWNDLQQLNPTVVSKVPFDKFVDNTFVNKAIKDLGANYPTGPVPSGH